MTTITYKGYSFLFDLNTKTLTFIEQSENIPETSVEVINAENLFNPNEATLNAYFKTITTEKSSSLYFITNYIPVSSGQTIYFKYYMEEYYCFFEKEYARGVVMYDTNKNVIEENSNASNIIDSGNLTIPAGVSYIRMAIPSDYLNGFIVSTKEITEYKAYDKDKVEKRILTYMADKYDIAVGKNLNLFNINLCPASQKYDIGFSWDCDIGTITDTGISFRPTENDIGTHTAKLNVYTDGKLYCTKTTNINVVEDKIKTNMNLLCLGDSLTAGKLWIPMLSKYSNNKITPVGTLTSMIKSDLLGGTIEVMHEGRPGWRAGTIANGESAPSYLTTAEGNAFFDVENEYFSYSYYKNSTGISPDAVIVFLGRNGMGENPTKNANNIVEIINNIRSADSRVPIFVVNTIRDNTSSYETSIKSLNLMKKLNSLIKEIPNVIIVPLQTCYDAVNYTTDTSDNVHPSSSEGYIQFADVIYSAICANQ